jgi:hypothetical protein
MMSGGKVQHPLSHDMLEFENGVAKNQNGSE